MLSVDIFSFSIEVAIMLSNEKLLCFPAQLSRKTRWAAPNPNLLELYYYYVFRCEKPKNNREGAKAPSQIEVRRRRNIKEGKS